MCFPLTPKFFHMILIPCRYKDLKIFKNSLFFLLFLFLSFLVYQFSPCERPYHWAWFFSLLFVMQVQSQLPCQHCFLELMVPSPPPVVFSQTFWTSVPSELCFLGPGRQPISFDPSDLCLLLLPHVVVSGFLLGSLVSWKCAAGR